MSVPGEEKAIYKILRVWFIDGYSSIRGTFCCAGDGIFMFMVEERIDVKNIAFWVGEREDFILHFS
jgi:hypothetical protein